jgi:hypothetical protein
MGIVEKTKQASFIEATPLWYDDWYDGPLSGVCEYKGDRFYYTFTDVNDKRHRIYSVVVLPEEILAEMIRRHEDVYRVICGDHMDFKKDCGKGG